MIFIQQFGFGSSKGEGVSQKRSPVDGGGVVNVNSNANVLSYAMILRIFLNNKLSEFSDTHSGI